MYHGVKIKTTVIRGEIWPYKFQQKDIKNYFNWIGFNMPILDLAKMKIDGYGAIIVKKFQFLKHDCNPKNGWMFSLRLQPTAPISMAT